MSQCGASGCDQPARRRGHCSKHAARLRRTGGLEVLTPEQRREIRAVTYAGGGAAVHPNSVAARVSGEERERYQAWLRTIRADELARTKGWSV